MIIYSTKEIIFTSIISKYSQSNAGIKHIWDKICLFKKFRLLKKMWDNPNSKILKSGNMSVIYDKSKAFSGYSGILHQ